MLQIMAGLHDFKKTGLHFTGTVSYLFPLECFQAPGLDQHVWIMDAFPSLIQGGSLLTLQVCQLGHITLKQHYHNNMTVDSLTLWWVCNCKHLQSHLYDVFLQISRSWQKEELIVWTSNWWLQFSFNSRSIFFFQSQLMAWGSSPVIKDKCCISIQISVFFICILNQLNWQRTNPNQSLHSLSKLQSAIQYEGPTAFIKRSVTLPEKLCAHSKT